MLLADRAHELLRRTITDQYRHADYTRTVDLSADYLTILTGEDYKRLLTRFIRREENGEYLQRLDLTHQNLSSTAAPLVKTFSQISRVQGIRKGVEIEGGRDRDRTDLLDVLSDFSAGLSLDDYVTHQYDVPALYDPNAFIVLEWDSFEAQKGERARPYPLAVPCEQVLDFHYHRGELSYLVIASPVWVETRDIVTGRLVQTQHTDYILYSPTVALRYYYYVEGREDMPDTGVLFENGLTKYVQAEYNPNLPLTPALRIGTKTDPLTNHRTCVSSLFHAALSQFKELINHKSQKDLTLRLHGYPKRYEYADPCPGELNSETGQRMGCYDGITNAGTTCGVCGGTGRITHLTEQDTIYRDIPKDKDRFFDLDKLAYSEAPAVESIDLLSREIAALQSSIYQTVFNTDYQVKTSGKVGVETATELNIGREDKNNTLVPFADGKARVYKTIVRITAAIMDIAGKVSPLFEVPRDLKLSSLPELYLDLKAARDAGAPSFEIEQILDDIARKRYEADPNALERYFIKKQHLPYIALTLEQFTYFDSVGNIPKDMAVLFANQDIVFGELEQSQPLFYTLPFAERDTLVSAKVATLTARLNQSVSLTSFGAGKVTSGTFLVGDTVMVKPGKEHMPEHAGMDFTVAEVQGNTYALKLPDGTIHKWYTADELMSMG